MTSRERAIMEGLCAFGWAIVDPWHAKNDGSVWEVYDAGPVCPVCGKAARMTDKWPTGKTFANPDNHSSDCPLAELLREDQ